MRSSPEQLRELYRHMDSKVYESELEGRNRAARRYLKIVRQYVRSGRLLDVGCAAGLFLSHAFQGGWNITGLEPNEKLYEEAQRRLAGKGEVHCTTLEVASLGERAFDVITLWDVLEHVPEPRCFLQTCCRLLRRNGYLFINVPDLDSWQARVLGRRWPLFIPEHLNYFNRQSLRLCGERAALTPVRFGRRLAWFSLKYVAYRAAQHGIPGSNLLRKTAQTPMGRPLIPVSLGETFIVLTSILLA
jgi:SAM-dependent methyltransferase